MTIKTDSVLKPTNGSGASDTLEGLGVAFGANSKLWDLSYPVFEGLTLHRLCPENSPVTYWAPRRAEIERVTELACTLHGSNPGRPTILEIGAGSGLISYLLACTGKVDVIAVEPDQRHVSLTPYRHHNLRFEAIDAPHAAQRYSGSNISVVLNSYMPPDVNLTPTIRSIGASAIVYSLLRFGGTGVPEYAAKSLALQHGIDLDEQISYRPGLAYKNLCEWYGPAHCDIVEWLRWSPSGQGDRQRSDWNKIDIQVKCSVPTEMLDQARLKLDAADGTSLAQYPWEPELCDFSGSQATPITWIAP